MIQIQKLPESGSVWLHEQTGERYTVLLLSNMLSNRADFPQTVVYFNEAGAIFNKPLSDWHRGRVQDTNRDPELVRAELHGVLNSLLYPELTI